MSAQLSIDQLLNSTLIQTLLEYISDVALVVSESAGALVELQPPAYALLHPHFDDFQSHLLYAFVLLFVVNVVLIGVAWAVFGRSICERFMKPATSKAIEELKASVSRLKLPKEHTPRI